ncbi:MAG: hypothetical protein QOH06_1971 [Acidobacteriota bacterium]|jgi:hypothetical protein|nr:hypothetical protein [Acidobacteriota bacterium]
MVTQLPPPPAPLVERLEASFPYEYLWAIEGETSPEGMPVSEVHGEEPGNPIRLAFSESAANPIELLLDRLGYYFRPLFPEIWREKTPVTGSSKGGAPGGVGIDPVPAGDPIPVGGGGPNGG